MYKKTGFLVVSLALVFGLAQPEFISAGSLNRYAVPQNYSLSNQGYQSSSPSRVSESVYERFEREIKDYDSTKRKRMAAQYQEKADAAIRRNEVDAARHYERLIETLGY